MNAAQVIVTLAVGVVLGLNVALAAWLHRDLRHLRRGRRHVRVWIRDERRRHG